MDFCPYTTYFIVQTTVSDECLELKQTLSFAKQCVEIHKQLIEIALITNLQNIKKIDQNEIDVFYKKFTVNLN